MQEGLDPDASVQDKFEDRMKGLAQRMAAAENERAKEENEMVDAARRRLQVDSQGLGLPSHPSVWVLKERGCGLAATLTIVFGCTLTLKSCVLCLQEKALEGLSSHSARLEPILTTLDNRMREAKSEAAKGCTFMTWAEKVSASAMGPRQNKCLLSCLCGDASSAQLRWEGESCCQRDEISSL